MKTRIQKASIKHFFCCPVWLTPTQMGTQMRLFSGAGPQLHYGTSLYSAPVTATSRKANSQQSCSSSQGTMPLEVTPRKQTSIALRLWQMSKLSQWHHREHNWQNPDNWKKLVLRQQNFTEREGAGFGGGGENYIEIQKTTTDVNSVWMQLKLLKTTADT